LVCGLLGIAGIFLNYAFSPSVRVPINVKGPHKIDESGRYGTQYWAEMTIGNPEQVFTALFDTGSSNVWVPSSDCATDKNRYDGGRSSTFQDLGSEVQLQYGTGACSGTAGHDFITVGGMQVDQIFGRMDEMDSFFDNVEFDGIVGLGLKDLVQGPGAPWIATISEANVLPQTNFRFSYASESSGTIDFGLTPVGPHLWVDVGAPEGRMQGMELYWMAPVESYRIGEKAFDLPRATPAVVDSGTSCLILPEKAFAAFEAAAKEAGVPDTNKLIPCDSKLPDIAVTFAESNGTSREFTMTSSDYLLEMESMGCMACVQDGGEQMLLGDVFHRAYGVIYDYDKRQLGFPIPASVEAAAQLATVHAAVLETDVWRVLALLSFAAVLTLIAHVLSYVSVTPAIFSSRDRRSVRDGEPPLLQVDLGEDVSPTVAPTTV
jgi:hypothetical protein